MDSGSGDCGTAGAGGEHDDGAGDGVPGERAAGRGDTGGELAGFTTAAGQAVAADTTTVTIAPDGFVSVNLAPNLGATPAGEYYTAVYYMSDGTTSTQYWVVPAAAQAAWRRCRRR
jgi:hypothetical protein